MARTDLEGAGSRGASSPPRTGVGCAAAVLALMALAGCGGEVYRDRTVPMTTVERVDLERYQGLWYEIARFPVRFQEGCEGVTARYAVREDGSVLVLNSCFREGLDAPPVVVDGTAVAVDGTNARLKVTFLPRWLPFGRGDYWVLYLDEDYEVAVVGVPRGSAGWILAREPQIGEEALTRALAALAANGYDTSRIEMTVQPAG